MRPSRTHRHSVERPIESTAQTCLSTSQPSPSAGSVRGAGGGRRVRVFAAGEAGTASSRTVWGIARTSRTRLGRVSILKFGRVLLISNVRSGRALVLALGLVPALALVLA